MAKCTSPKADGTPCQANALAGRSLCAFHHPENAATQAAARVEGGRARSRPRAVLPPDHPELPVGSARDVGLLLSDTINQVRTGRLDPRVANTVGYLASVLLRSLEVGDLEDRLASLEASIRSNPAFEASAIDRELGAVREGAKPW